MSSRFALIVANDQYQDPGLRSLFAPRHDAQSLRELLRDPETGDFDPAEILINESKAEVERAMERIFRSARPGDLVLLYFSGHGVRSRNGRLHLAVTNTDLQLLAASSISASFVKELLDESDASSTVILLDCCYSGAFSDGKVKADARVDVGDELKAGRGTYVITASSSVERAGDGEPAGADHGPNLSAFTDAIVRGLATGAADVRGIGRITPHDLWEYVRMEVPRRTPAQTPTQYGYVEDEVHLAHVRQGFAQAAPGSGQRVHLGDILGRLSHSADQGLRADDWWGTGRLVIPIGRVFRDTKPGTDVCVDLANADGHLLVIGKIRSGKSTLLRTVVAALALTNAPAAVRFCFLESGGNKLGSLRRLPFDIRIARDDQDEAIGHLLDELDQVVSLRKRLFSEHYIDSAGRFRIFRDTRPDEAHPDIFLLVDQLADFAPYLGRIKALASVGLDYAVHVVVAARNWREVPDELAELIHCKIELNLDSPRDSRLDPRLAERLTNDIPGWAIRRGSRFLVALPHLGSAGGSPAEVLEHDSSDGALELVDRVSATWPRPTVPGRTTPDEVAPLTVTRSILDLLGLAELSLPALAAFRSATAARDRLKVPIGVNAQNKLVFLDLKEPAQDGMGPHGMIVGATGSGKSELLRSLVTSLALRHDSHTITFVLIDFKGGATFSALAHLPHVTAVISGLSGDLALVDRMIEAITGEVVRRQEALRAAGNFAGLRDYDRARAGGQPLAPLPALLVICDEFSELLAVKPDLIDLFVLIGRLGRSLGVHLLLSTQRLEEGRLRGLDTYLSYRIGLRTFSAMESRTVLGVPDAYELPRSPGHGYLKAGADPLRRLLVAGSFQPVETPDGRETRSIAEAVAALVSEVDPPAREVWLPPLDKSVALDELLGPVVADPVRGLSFANPESYGALQVPIALVDKPREQLRDVMWLQLAGAGGHVAVVGSTLSGKSTALRSMICGLALTHTPAEVQIYCLDFGGGSLGPVKDLPHVGGVAGRLDTVGVRRTVGEIATLLVEREAMFTDLRIDSMAAYRRRRTDGDPYGDVFLVVDGWATLRSEYEELEPAVADILTRGPSYGIHLVASASRWTDFRPAVRDLFGSKLELRLGDPAESEIDRRAAAAVPARPGHGITEHPTDKTKGLHLLTVRPEVTTLGDTFDLVKAIATNWHGPVAPRVRLLPASVPYAELDLDRGTGLRLPIGISEADLQPVEIDFASDPHFLLFGDAECGKSSFLRALATSVIRRFTPEQARIILVDYRRSLMDLPESEHRIGYGTRAPKTLELMESVADSLHGRLPGADITAPELRDRSWWRGPELFVLVDDYDLVAANPVNPLAGILEYLPQARDVGLHLILTRRAGGASRALYDPVIQRLRELSTPGLVMSGPSDEGALIGTIRPTALPPGRGRLLTRREGIRLIQLAYLPPAAG
jgi:DNA segregation ATPase FtsK/SpoIIIE, S-DNA-T family